MNMQKESLVEVKPHNMESWSQEQVKSVCSYLRELADKLERRECRSEYSKHPKLALMR